MGVYFSTLTTEWVPPTVSVTKYKPVTGCIFFLTVDGRVEQFSQHS